MYVKKVNKPHKIIWFSLLFLYCTVFMNVGVYAPVFALPFVCIYLIKNEISKPFMLTLYVLIMFSTIYAVSQFNYGYASNFSTLANLLYPSIFLILGYYLAGRKDYKSTFQYIYIVIASLTLFGFLSVIKTLVTFGSMRAAFVDFGWQRFSMNLWDDSLIRATGINVYLSVGLALLPIIFLPKQTGFKKGNTIKFFSVILFGMSFFSTLQLGNRTGLVIILISLITVLILTKKLSVKKMFNTFLFIFGSLCIITLFNLNVFGIKTAFENTSLGSRFLTSDISDDSRFTLWQTAFLGMFKSPMGGREAYSGYVHNLWLDVSNDSGIIPFVLICLFCILAFWTFVKLISREIPLMLKGLFIALFVTFIAVFAVEPILQGWSKIFNMFCFFIGIVHRLNFEYARQLNTKGELIEKSPNINTNSLKHIAN